MERPILTDLTGRYQWRFAGGNEPKTLRMQNAHSTTDVYAKFAADDGSTVPSDAYFDVVVPAGAEVIVELKDISVQVIITNSVDELSIFRY